jgi:bifunctional non-homologous end joining protein LigD
MGLEGPSWQTPRYHGGEGAALIEATAEQGLEGVVAKRLDSQYAPGRRSSAWIKVKNKQRQEVVIGGWLPEKERPQRLGALLVGHRDEEGRFRYAGRVGTGWDAKERARLERALKPLARDSAPFEGKRGPKGARYVEPRLVAEVEFTEWTNEAILRHPAYKGLVDRKPTADARPARPARPAEEAVLDSAETTASLGPGRKAGKNAVQVEVDGRTLKLSNLDKVMYPKAGFTKGDLIDYYVRIAPVLLPHLHDRPLTLKRYPDGVEGKHFYEKQCPSHRPDWVQTAAVWSRQNKKNIDFCLVNDLPTLVWTSNLADIELHTSLSLAEPVDRPTMMVFDLDPGAPANIIACCRVGVWLRDLFAQLKLESFAKTSGSKGLQVYVPLNTDEVTYDDTKPFARAVAELLEKQHPKQVVSRMTKSLRGGKVLIDWSQNDDHKTTICVYSLRAKERPTVSTPVAWDEVEAASRRRSGKVLTFEHDEVLKRVERDGDLFAPVLALRQALPSL